MTELKGGAVQVTPGLPDMGPALRQVGAISELPVIHSNKRYAGAISRRLHAARASALQKGSPLSH